MRRWALMGAAGALGVLGVAVATFLAFALLPLGAPLRHRIAETALTHYWGEPVTVEGAVTVQVWPRPALQLENVTSTTDGKAPVHIGMLRVLIADWHRLPFEPVVFALMIERGRFEFPLVGTADAAPGTLLSSPVALFSLLPRLRVEDVVFNFADVEDGWEFTFEVQKVFSRLRDGVEYMDATATLNGTPVTLAFQFDREPHILVPGTLPYGAVMTLGAAGLTSTLKTRSATPTFDENLSMALTVQATSIADLLALAGIARSVDGTANLRAQLFAQPDVLAMRGLALDLDFTDGKRVAVTGGIADLQRATGVDLNVVMDVDPAAKPAVSPRDITITRISGNLQDGRRGLMLAGATVATNAFSQNLKEIGPIEVAAIRRDQSGRVAFYGITVQAGPLDKPVFRLKGNVKDVLDLRGITLSGDFDIPLDDVLAAPDATGPLLGRLAGSATLSDANGDLELERLTAELTGGKIISGTVNLDPRPPVAAGAKVPGTVIDLDFTVPKVSALTAALGSNSAFDGPLSFDGQITRTDDSVASRGRLTIGTTRVDGDLRAVLRDERPFISGKLTSPVIRVDELSPLLNGTPPPRLKIVGAQEPEGGSQLDLVGSSDLDIEITADRIEGGGNSGNGLSARLRLDHGSFRADPVSVNFGGGHIRAAVTSQDGSRLAAKGTGEGWPLGPMFKGAGGMRITGTAGLSFDLSVNLDTKGNLLQTLNGSIVARVRNGSLGTGLLDLAGLGLLGGLFNPAVMKGESVLRCVRVPLRFSDGVGRTDPAIVAETENIEAVARGTLNLASNSVNLMVVPRPLNGGLWSVGYPFTVKGQLDAPSIAVVSSGDTNTRGIAKCAE